ncbi:LOW QUALITY PROTEIN: leucine-rich repeat-containing protein 42 [Anguilla anguilla]|uniref:LOW QUALITY PROTEIN: leucine-rich repeat-containing protein 42 n=1 Tax=Anguilla anguilla TaxID=7936 RepID=UPI0015AEBA93|nr:LOW QUALITY PROTEIN: leucine-rich repeat-containing protein 42 [Anguilla anguilla]
MFSSEQTQDDCEPVYIRENGILRRVNEPKRAEEVSQYRNAKPCRLFGRGFSVELCIENQAQASTHIKRKEHFVFTYNEGGSLRYSVKSLFDISLLFIAENVHYVDSLIGFPEQMAERLFRAAEAKQKFSDPVYGPRALQVFSEAYGDLVLKSLCLRNRHLLVSEKLEGIKVFHSLQCLDLFGCKLGDNHEILQHLTSDALSSLIHLSLGDNHLSNRGLQKLTAPARVMKRGLGKLQLLDLSWNAISEQTVGYLSCFPNLQELDISETNMELTASLRQTLQNKLGFVYSEAPLQGFSHSHCKTQGWAEQIVNQWEIHILESSKPKRDAQPRTEALRFYGRHRFIQETLKAPPQAFDKGYTKRIQFYKPTPNSQMQPTGSTSELTKTPSQSKRKRAPDSAVEGSGDSAPPEKRASSSSLSVEDWALLNSY